MRRAAGVVVALVLLVLSLGPIEALPSAGLSPAASKVSPQQNYTLFGDAVAGWGFTSGTLTKPGPTLSLYLGDEVSLTLSAADTLQHNWFIDFNNNSQADPSAGEHPSPNFNGPGDPTTIVFSSVADRPGNWTYRCAFHPASMHGTIQVRATGRSLAATLIGSATRGWGLPNGTISDPGPSILVGANALVTITLRADANDSGIQHNWFIDYDNNSVPDPTEPTSATFNGPSDPATVVFPFNATRPGQFTYRCAFHPTKMLGTILVLGQASAPPGGLGVGVIPGVLLIALAGVLVFAGVYHVRAVRAARRRP